MIAMSDGSFAPAHPDAVVVGDTYRFTVLTPRLIRMEWHERGEFVDERTQLVVARDFPVPEFTVTRLSGGGVEILTEYLRLRYDGKEFSEAGLSVKLLKGATDIHYTTWRFGYEYPENPPHRGNLLGTARTLDNADGAVPLEPGVLSTYGFAVVDDSETALLAADGWIAGRPDPGTRASRDLYLFGYGHDYASALRDYYRLAGPTPVVPRYALGNWWSRYWPYSADEYVALMDRFAAERIPFSVAVIDMDWHVVDVDPEIGTGWTGYTWNRELFPDPESFLAALHERGLATTLNLHPADGVRRHEEAYAQVAGAVGVDPVSGLPVEFDVTSRDFVDAYLRYLHHPLEEQGVDFWWIDWQSGGATSVPGLDPLWMLNHIHFHDSGRNGKRPLTFSRYAGLGSHRYPVGFSGDTITSWKSLEFQPSFTSNAANVGYTWWSHDIGGHMMGTKDAELEVRWYQFGAFSPINRLHSSPNPFFSKEPWAHGSVEYAAIAPFMRLRHRLVPALYTAAWLAHTDAMAVVRPMYHDWPDELFSHRMPNQYMLGEHLLVAPITAPMDETVKIASVKAWLPEGGWFDIFTGQFYEGGVAALHRGLTHIPVFARAGSVLPLADAMEPIVNAPETLTLRVYPGNGISHLIEDRGEGDPQATDRHITRIVQSLSVRDDGCADLTLAIEPTTGPEPLRTRHIVVEIVGVSAVEGRSDAVLMEDELLCPALRIDLGEVDMTEGMTVEVNGLAAAEVDVAAETFTILDEAEIDLSLKQWAWSTVKQTRGAALAHSLAALDVPVLLRDALFERADAAKPW